MGSFCLLISVAAAEEADRLPREQPPQPVVPPPALGWLPACNVKDFGAFGDGRADDTEAIQKAIDTAVHLPGATYRVVLPAGNYRITRSLFLERFTNSLHLQGAGDSWLVNPAPTRLTWDGEPGGVMLDACAAYGTRLSDLCLDGNGRAGICIRVNSRPGVPSDHWTAERVTLIRAKKGIECGGVVGNNCAADMTFIDLCMMRLEVGFHAMSHQSVNFVFIRPVIGEIGTGLWFEKGGSVTCNLLAGTWVKTAVRIDAGDVNTGNYYFNGVKIECPQDGETGKRPVLFDVRGPHTIVKITSLNSGTMGLPETEPHTPLFRIAGGASVSVDSSLLMTHKVAELKGGGGAPAWIQFDNCRFGYCEPRWPECIQRDGNAGYELRNCATGSGMIRNFRVDPPVFAAEVPHGVKAEAISPTAVKVTWRDGAEETGYRIERSADGQNWQTVGEVPRDQVEFTDQKLTPGATYYYRVRAFNQFDTSWYSNEEGKVTTPNFLSDHQPISGLWRRKNDKQAAKIAASERVAGLGHDNAH